VPYARVLVESNWGHRGREVNNYKNMGETKAIFRSRNICACDGKKLHTWPVKFFNYFIAINQPMELLQKLDA